MSFMDGAWRSITGLRNTRTNEPIEFEYRFDKSGKGEKIIRERSGNVCRGPAQAQFLPDGKLQITDSGARCQDGTGYNPDEITCTVGDGGRAVCQGRNPSGTFPVTIQRAQ